MSDGADEWEYRHGSVRDMGSFGFLSSRLALIVIVSKGDRLRAVGRVIRNGKTLVVTLGEVFAETAGASKQIAMITATMMVVTTGSGLRD